PHRRLRRHPLRISPVQATSAARRPRRPSSPGRRQGRLPRRRRHDAAACGAPEGLGPRRAAGRGAGGGQRAGPGMTAPDLLNLTIAALLLAGVYAAMSVGMTIIYGVMKIVNLAHAGFLMLGAYFVYELYERLRIDPLAGILLAFPAFFLAGAGLHRTLIR